MKRASAVLLFAALLGALALVGQPLWTPLLRDWAVDRGYRGMHRNVVQSRLGPQLAAAPMRILRSALSAGLPSLAIEIPADSFQKLMEKRAEALARGLLVQGSGDFVPASIHHGGRSTRVRLRLKGDLPDHFNHQSKWSFRVHVRGEDHIFGLRRFSLQHPRARAYHGEALVFETLRHMGVLAPRYFFVEATVNARHIGVMAVEEHFSRELLEANGRLDGVIVRFDESLLWETGVLVSELLNSPFYSYKNAPIDSFRTGQVARSGALSRQQAVAVGLLRGFVDGTLKPSEVFDAELMGRCLAVAELWGSYHVVNWRNVRFYLNPITLKLEPIGYDANLAVRYPVGTPIAARWEMIASMLRDPKIFAPYSKALRGLAVEIEHGNLLEKLRGIERGHLAGLHAEFFLLEEFPWEELRRRARFVRALGRLDLRGFAAKLRDFPSMQRASARASSLEHFPVLVHAHRVGDADAPVLEVANAVPRSVEIDSIQWISEVGQGSASFQPLVPLELPLVLPPTAHGALPRRERIAHRPPPDGARYSLRLSAKVRGEARRDEVTAQPYHAALDRHPIPESSVEEQLSLHRFLSVDRQQRTLSVAPGRWRVDRSLVVPPGFSLSVAQGTTLEFAPRAALISHGALRFRGTERAPVVLRGGPGEAVTWQGLVVLDARAPSSWTHVTVLDTTGIRRPGWELSAGATFHRSDLEMENCTFRGNRAEDALFIAHSGFRLKQTRIVDAVADGLAFWFSEGSVHGGSLQDIGSVGQGNGLEAWGSRIEIQGTQFRGVGGETFSVARGSEVSVDGEPIGARDVEVRRR